MLDTEFEKRCRNMTSQPDIQKIVTEYLRERLESDLERRVTAPGKPTYGIAYQIVDALDYMHTSAKLLHFDVKPENILVTSKGRPFLTDLGFARDLNRYGVDEKVEVGFTWKYAHPKLTNPQDGARISRVPEKAKRFLRGDELTPRFDIFAFGRTLQEVLGKLELEYQPIHPSALDTPSKSTKAIRGKRRRSVASPPFTPPAKFVREVIEGRDVFPRSSWQVQARARAVDAVQGRPLMPAPFFSKVVKLSS